MKKEERNSKQGDQLENRDRRGNGSKKPGCRIQAGMCVCVCFLPCSPCISEISDVLHLFLAVLEAVLIPLAVV